MMKDKKPKVFLGGTCNESLWREDLKPLLDNIGFSWFDPVVKDWDEVAQAKEVQERRDCDFCLYTITPRMTGLYSIAEVVEDSIKRPGKTIMVTLEEDFFDSFPMTFKPFQMKSLKAVGDMVIRNGGQSFLSLEDAAKYLESRK